MNTIAEKKGRSVLMREMIIDGGIPREPLLSEPLLRSVNFGTMQYCSDIFMAIYDWHKIHVMQ